MPELPPLLPPDDDELLLDDELDEDEELDDDDEPELVTAPLDVLTLPDDVEIPPVEVLTPPVEVEIPPVDVLTPPVDVETPPVDVEVLTPPVDVETPPDVLDVLEPPEPPDDVELLMPPVLLDVDEITTVPPPLLPPPPEKPPKKPPPKPPPNPPDPPITTGTPPPPPPSYGACGMNGTGMGGIPWLATVTTVGVQVLVVVVRTTLRTRLTLRTGVRCAILRAFTFFFATLYTCAGGVSATCIAPPPISAPPQVHAQSFAKAIRTDIFSTFFSLGAKGLVPMRTDSLCLLMCRETQNKSLSSIALTLFGSRRRVKMPNLWGQRAKRPELELFAIQLFTARSGFHSFCYPDRAYIDLPLVRSYPRVYRPPRE